MEPKVNFIDPCIQDHSTPYFRKISGEMTEVHRVCIPFPKGKMWEMRLREMRLQPHKMFLISFPSFVFFQCSI